MTPPRSHIPLALLLALIPYSGASLADEGRVIVKYRVAASSLKQAQALARVPGMAARLGLALRAGRQIDARTQALHASGISSAGLAERLGRDADVEYAVPDQLRHFRALPNDPLFQSQWHLQTTEAAAIHATSAWDISTGSTQGVVAIIDTGVRYDHPDLSAKLLPGYDFIGEAANAGDGDGRDADASDAGDFVSAADLLDPNLRTVCGTDLARHDSSWHGTRIAGIVGGASNNSLGIAGVNWGVKLLPVRVLGKCGGFDSDIMAAMRWAAGLTVPDIPDNPNPAGIINLSLGGVGTCNAAYRDTIAQLSAKGVLVVASAGNETGPVETPGNCAGVLAVGGVRHVGTKVGYSSLGPEVGISAPAGNCVNSSGACLYSIQTTTNLGTSTPGTNSYSDAFNYNAGTSFAAPQAAGVAALMLSINPVLSPAEIISRLQQAARPFPSEDGLPTCPDVSSDDASLGQCNCTTSTCGAGLLDAATSLAAAQAPVARIRSLDALLAGSLIRLDAGDSMASLGRAIIGWRWTLDAGPPGASLSVSDTAATSLQASSAGDYTLSLTVTDDQGASTTTSTTLTVASAAAPAPASGGSGGGAIEWGTLLGLAGLAGIAAHARRRKTRGGRGK